MWNIEKTSNEILKTRTKIVICHHANDVKNYNHIKNVKFFHNPHCAEKSIFRDYDLKKDFDFQIIGLINSDIYPFRSRLKHLIENIMIPKYQIRYRILEHPGGRINNVDDQVINYAMQINRAKINITCSSKFKYALAKYSEVPLCRTLLAADIPDENNEWYSNWMCALDPNLPDNEIVKILYDHIFNDELLYRKTNYGYDENMKNRTQEHYANNLVRIIKEIL
jgi:hypothetical protein